MSITSKAGPRPAIQLTFQNATGQLTTTQWLRKQRNRRRNKQARASRKANR